MAVGYWTDISDIQNNWEIDRVFEPEISEEERKKKIKGWEKAMKCSYGWAKEN